MTFTVHAIEPGRLDAMRASGTDEHGHPLVPYDAFGWEPLRCCLRRAHEGEPVVLIAYSPLTSDTPWTETGPVYIHPAACDGYDPQAGLPAAFRTGPRVLRSYRADGTLDYDLVRVVGDGVDLEGEVRELLARGAAEVHVRALDTQCFTYAVRP